MVKENTNYIKPESNAHWYAHDGTPHHGATLRDARKQNLLPSVTTVLMAKSAPALEVWKQNKLLAAALAIPDTAKEAGDHEALAKQVILDAKQEVTVAAARGTAVHDGIESIFGEQPWDGDNPQLRAINDWIKANVASKAWLEEVVVNEEVGYAGRSDGLIEHQEHGSVVVDWKTQNVKQNAKGDWKPAFYDKYLLQLAAYRACVPNTPPVLTVVINSNAPEVYEKLWTEEETDAAFEAFKHIHAIWCWDKKFHPGAAKKEEAA